MRTHYKNHIDARRHVITTHARGFTLLETLFYLVLSGLMVGVLGLMAVNIMSAKQKITAEEEVAYNAHSVLQHIEQAVEKAGAVTSPAVGATSTTLHLEMADPGRDSLVFTITDGVLQVREGTGADVTLTTDSVVVERLLFKNVTGTSSPGVVYVELDISAYNPEERQEYDASETLQTAFRLYDSE